MFPRYADTVFNDHGWVQVSSDPSQRPYWLAFSLVSGIGARRLARLLQFFGSAEAAWLASEHDLRLSGVEAQIIDNVIAARQKRDIAHEIARIESVGAHFITLDDDAYPSLLRHIDDAPPILYVRGSVLPHDARALAIVGTRKPTHYGSDAAYRIARELSAHGVTVVSGLAHGIDAAAHRGALDGGGRTIAVLGNGIDQVYPRDHAELATRISQSGALMTEFALGSKPEARHFPARNRIMSGLSLAVLIVEAPLQSGALITATAAAEQGRDVFAIPGSIFSPASVGTNKLIQDGAQLVTSAEDILEALDLSTLTNASVQPDVMHDAPENDEERIILRLLSHEPIHVDDIIRQTRMNTAVVLSTLTMLELKQLARNVGAMQYCLG